MEQGIKNALWRKEVRVSWTLELKLWALNMSLQASIAVASPVSKTAHMYGYLFYHSHRSICVVNRSESTNENDSRIPQLRLPTVGPRTV